MAGLRPRRASVRLLRNALCLSDAEWVAFDRSARVGPQPDVGADGDPATVAALVAAASAHLRAGLELLSGLTGPDSRF